MSTVLNGKKIYTALDLERMPSSERFELVEGELVPMTPPGGFHGSASAVLSGFVTVHIITQQLGRAFTAETGFLLNRDPDTVLAPDFAFVRAGQLKEKTPDGYVPVAPDLVLETRSPSDRPQGVARKIKMWLDHGTKIVWDLDLKQRTLTAHLATGVIETFGPDDVLTGGEVLPGFALPMREIFDNA